MDKIIQMLVEVLEDTLKVFKFGASVHPDGGDTPNFLTPNGHKCSKHDRGSSILRHAARTFMRPEIKDKDSDLSELLHLIASASIMYIRHKRNISHPEDEVKNETAKK